jgi:hypothetical protein
VFDTLSQIGVYWDSSTERTIAVERSPGYTIGHRYRATVRVDEEESDFHPGGLAGRTWKSGGTATMLPPDISRRAFAGALLDLTIDIEVFQSSVPGQHLWMPERGDFRILWRDEVRGTYP